MAVKSPVIVFFNLLFWFWGLLSVNDLLHQLERFLNVLDLSRWQRAQRHQGGGKLESEQPSVYYIQMDQSDLLLPVLPGSNSLRFAIGLLGDLNCVSLSRG